MRCSKCGTDNPATNNFCAKCGNALAKRCAKCAAENPPSSDFCGKCGASLGTSAPVETRVEAATPSVRVVASAEPSAVEGERKTVTALFADIKGSTELEQDLDPEEARAIVDPALKLMIDAVRRYDGYIVQSTGDGIFALFGAPVAHEDHPQRALYAALRMQEELRRYSDKLLAGGGAPLEIRVGVNTGEVVVRSISTGGGNVEYTPIGHTTNLASRMQTVAPTGSIAISEQTRKFVEGYFTLKPMGPTQVKGVGEAINIYEVTGLGPLRSRLERAAGRGFTKFVGREREMEAMKLAAERASAGRGQIVATMAEAGVGKSRLLFEFKAAHSEGWMLLSAFSVSHGKASAYIPVIDLLHGYFNIGSEDDQRTRREKIAGRITKLDRALEEAIPYLYNLLGIGEENDPLAQMDVRQRGRSTLDAIKRILLRESLNQPLMVIFEDLHWIDDATQRLLNLLADSIGTAKVLLLVNYRPEYSHQWNSKSYYTQLRLDPLGKESAEQMLSALLGDAEDLKPLKRLITERAEGNPFFMEEMVLAMFDDGALVRNGAVKLTRPLNQLKIPPTVQAILASRVDRLAPGHKDLLQTLAVIGKEFKLGLVSRVVARAEPELTPMLSELQGGEFIYEQPAVGEIEYTFKHALTQEVAYNSILVERRKTLHEQIGVAIEVLFRESLDDHLSELADHYARSSNIEKAIEYQTRAAKRELAQSGYRSAVLRLQDAIELFAKLPETKEHAELELDLQINYGAAVLATKGWYAPEAGKAYGRARELCQGRDKDLRLFPVLSGLHSFHLVRGEHPIAASYAEESIRLADRFQNDHMRAAAHLLAGFSKFFMGEFADAHSSFERSIGFYDTQRHQTLQAGASHQDPLVSAKCYDAIALWMLGYPDKAEKSAEDSILDARKLGYPFTMTWCLSQISVYYTICRDYRTAEKTTSEGLALARKHGLAFLRDQILGYQVISLAAQGKLDRPADRAATETGFAGSGHELAYTWALPILAEGFAGFGRFDIALPFVAQAAEIADRNQERYVESEIHRIKGELTLRQVREGSRKSEELRSAHSAAELSFVKAIEIARRRNAKSLELRATNSLARLLASQGKRDEARARLAEIYGWFTEGFDTADLKDAKALLDELSA